MEPSYPSRKFNFFKDCVEIFELDGNHFEMDIIDNFTADFSNDLD